MVTAQLTDLLPENTSQNYTIFAQSLFTLIEDHLAMPSSYGCAITIVYHCIHMHVRISYQHSRKQVVMGTICMYVVVRVSLRWITVHNTYTVKPLIMLNRKSTGVMHKAGITHTYKCHINLMQYCNIL